MNRNFYFTLGFLMANTLGVTFSCYGSDLSQTSDLSLSSSRSSSVRGVLESCGVKLGKAQAPLEDLPESFRTQVESRLANQEITARDEQKIANIYIIASGRFGITEEIRQKWKLEGVRHYVEAADLGANSVIEPIVFLLDNFMQKGETGLISQLGGEDNVKQAVSDLSELAKKLEKEEEQAAYEYERSIQDPSPPASVAGSGELAAGLATGSDEPLQN